jgi:hypothetical protein
MKFPYGAVDEDDDLNNYVKQRMIEESGKPSPSQQQSPAGIPTVTGKIRRRSPSKYILYLINLILFRVLFAGLFPATSTV